MTGTALNGLLVIALEQAVAGPFCTARLSDAGARVIKVEPPGGDFARSYDTAVHGESAYFVWLNRNKESIVLAFSDPTDRAILDRMLDRADIVVQNIAPSTGRRHGLDDESLRSGRPSLITCSITGYPSGGPHADAKAYDMLIQAETGLASITGRPEGPGRVGISLCDIAAGMYAYQRILEAVVERSNDGQGRPVTVSLFAAIADWMTVPLLHHLHGGLPPVRAGMAHPGIAPYGPFPAADGPDVMLAVQNQAEWYRLCADVLRQPALATDPRFTDNQRRVQYRAELDAAIASVTATLGRTDLVQRLEGARIATASLNGLAELWAHSDLVKGSVRIGDQFATMPEPVGWESGPLHDLGVVPAVDADGEALRREFAR